MVSFFQICISFSDEVELEELILSRYHNIDYVLAMNPSKFVRFIAKAREMQTEEHIKARWLALYPYMIMERIKFMPFEEYLEKSLGKNIDTRPTEEIIAEIEDLHKMKGSE